MMEILEDFPDDILAVKADGRITGNDYKKVLIPAANDAFTRHTRLGVYYETGQGFSGFDLDAMWHDFIFGVGNITHWKQIAVVTDSVWLHHAANVFRFFIPCPVRVFAADEAESARTWLLHGRN